MTEAARSFGFTAEPLDKFFIPHKLRSDHFKGDRPLRPKVRGQVDRAHTALSEQFVEVVFSVQRSTW
jgi:hypothetical protein